MLGRVALAVRVLDAVSDIGLHLGVLTRQILARLAARPVRPSCLSCQYCRHPCPREGLLALRHPALVQLRPCRAHA
eukprot:2574128-Pyramimonas_sp.AAC.1